MDKNVVTNRIVFLAKEFKVFDESELQTFIDEADTNDEVNIELIKSSKTNNVLAVKKTVLVNKEKERYNAQVHVSDNVFVSMLEADPTEHKEYIQWMLTVFRNMIKNNDISNEKARQFAEEDLLMANSYLKVFGRNKHKQKFKELCLSSFGTPKTDPSNINQYNSLSQLFDAVYPFIEREPSKLELNMLEFESKGEAKIAFKDRKWTVYIPYTTNANCVMEHFASWCTAKRGNGNYDSYTKNYRLPNNNKSNIYVIINNDLFEGKSKECYQIHFETRQVKPKSNDRNINLYQPVLSTSDGISEYFKNELSRLMLMCKDINNNVYRDFLIKFGFTTVLFDTLDEKSFVIRFENPIKGELSTIIPKIPDISRFKNVDEVILINIELNELHPSIGSLSQLQLLSLNYNKLKTLPKEIGKLNKLNMLSLTGNKLTDIPEEIKYLDKSNGGSLIRLSINESDVSKEVYLKLKKLLPTTSIGGI